jgi:hypothetical protein
MLNVCPDNPENYPGHGGDRALEDVRRLRYETVEDVMAIFWGSQEHGKWAVSKNYRDGYFCIGDLNRVASQKRRGGGVLCMWDVRVANAFNWLVVDTDCSYPPQVRGWYMDDKRY